jgi:hypothetical protein
VEPRNTVLQVTPTTSIRFPAPPREQLESRATAEGRTLSNLVVTLLAPAITTRTEQVPTEATFRETFTEAAAMRNLA